MPANFCTFGFFSVHATGNNEDALKTFPPVFVDTIDKSLTGSVLDFLNFGIGEFRIVEAGVGTNDNGESGRPADVNAVFGDPSPPPGDSSLNTGPILLVIFSGLAVFVIFILAMNRKHVRSMADKITRNTTMMDDEYEEMTTDADETDEAPSRHIARILGDAGDEGSWQGDKSEGVAPPVYTAVVDENGFPTAIEVEQNGKPIYSYPNTNTMHRLDETCNNPSCQLCQKKLKTTVFISSNDDQNGQYQNASRMLAERNYLAEDTVLL